MSNEVVHKYQMVHDTDPVYLTEAEHDEQLLSESLGIADTADYEYIGKFQLVPVLEVH